ncbi:MAG: hypothetical protein ACYC5G_00200 [Candidatus Doudnabacteria bacterium]
MKITQKTLQKLIALKPISIAITGSSASKESGTKSDLDIIAIFSDSNYVKRNKLQKLVSSKTRIYPFRLKEIKSLKSPHPFPTKFYYWWITKNSKTVWGKTIVENFNIKLNKNDFRELLAFERGVALSAMHSFRNKDKKTVELSFAKSCLFGTVAGIALTGLSIPTNYDTTIKKGVKVFPKYAKLIRKAGQIRRSGANLREQDIFDNLKYLHHIALKMN